ncbi:MAG: 2-C-methyl-D-erythritol 2,4-cyclodiphosphate synthase [Bacteroidales bacterium]|nr:2-C-methyl-D-erythritol 2,4-cyclodiphosphate synthase [Bacteroidales bacterium]
MTDIRIGNGIDVHAIGEGLKMWLCGVLVDETKGFIAHSDGDVAIHALCDAILGALAKGDIGHHFPDSDPAYEGIDSKKLLTHVAKIAADEGYRIGNLDITICLQSPKLAPYISAMRESLAYILNTDVDAVSVKATTTEHLGYIGRGEGCLCQASVVLIK